MVYNKLIWIERRRSNPARTRACLQSILFYFCLRSNSDVMLFVRRRGWDRGPCFCAPPLPPPCQRRWLSPLRTRSWEERSGEERSRARPWWVATHFTFASILLSSLLTVASAQLALVVHLSFPLPQCAIKSNLTVTLRINNFLERFSDVSFNNYNKFTSTWIVANVCKSASLLLCLGTPESATGFV